MNSLNSVDSLASTQQQVYYQMIPVIPTAYGVVILLCDFSLIPLPLFLTHTDNTKFKEAIISSLNHWKCSYFITYLFGQDLTWK